MARTTPQCKLDCNRKACASDLALLRGTSINSSEKHCSSRQGQSVPEPVPASRSSLVANSRLRSARRERAAAASNPLPFGSSLALQKPQGREPSHRGVGARGCHGLETNSMAYSSGHALSARPPVQRAGAWNLKRPAVVAHRAGSFFDIRFRACLLVPLGAR